MSWDALKRIVSYSSDGVQLAENTDYRENGLGSGTLKFGNSDIGYSYFFNGSIDDIRIYDRALSAEEVRLLYEMEGELPVQSVTLAKLSPSLSDLIDGKGSLEQALPAGSVIARKPVKPRHPVIPFFNEMNTTLLSFGKRRHRFRWVVGRLMGPR